MPSRQTARHSAERERESRGASSMPTSIRFTGLPVARPIRATHADTARSQDGSSSMTFAARTITKSMSLAASPSPRAAEPKSVMFAGAGRIRLALRLSSSIRASRSAARASKGRTARCTGTIRTSTDGGTSRRSTMPSSTRRGTTRATWARLTPESSAKVLRFSSPVVPASTARMRPCASGITASIGRVKSTWPF